MFPGVGFGLQSDSCVCALRAGFPATDQDHINDWCVQYCRSWERWPQAPNVVGRCGWQLLTCLCVRAWQVRLGPLQLHRQRVNGPVFAVAVAPSRVTNERSLLLT